MIYFDNAATTLVKPPEVIAAVTQAMQTLGNAGRGVHEASLGAARTVFDTRLKLAAFFHAESPKQIVFTANSTESLNIALKGLLNPGDRVLTTVLEHNSVLRPLYELQERGLVLDFVDCDGKGMVSPEAIEACIREDTRAIVCTHGSNLTGNLLDIRRIGETARAHGCLFVVDASQTAGAFPINVQELMVDVLCFTGHKGLFGPQGTGGMYVREGLTVRPLLTGGSGVQSYSRVHPREMPTALEAGTLNGHGLAGLGAAVDFITATGQDAIRAKEQALMRQFYNGVKDNPKVRIYGDFGEGRWRCPIVALNLGGYDSSEVSDELFMTYGIATRPGAHCAPLMHKALGTVSQGAVRFSFSYFNTPDEVDSAIAAIAELTAD